MSLVDTIKASLLAEKPKVERASCFLCQRTFTPARGHGINRRFCGALCLAAYDAGYVVSFSEPKLYSLPLRGDGFAIECAGCRKSFASRGLRCCSQDCERKTREREDIAATMAEVGMEPAERPACQCCGGPIPRWRGAGTRKRATPKGTRYCSEKCSAKARRQVASQTAVSSLEVARKCPPNRGLQ